MTFFNLTTYYSWGFAIGFIFSFTMGLGVCFSKSKRPEIKPWALLCFCTAIWAAGRWLIMHANSPEQAYFWQRCMYLGAIPINIVYFYFVLKFVQIKGFKIFLKLGFLAAFILIAINLTSHLFISQMQTGNVFRFYEIAASPIYYFHTALYALYPSTGIYLLIQAYRKVNGLQRLRIGYVLAASVTGFASGWTTFPLAFRFPWMPFGAPLVSLYIAIIGYAIIRHHLMDIHIVVQRTLLASLLTVVLVCIYGTTVAICARLLEGRVLQPSIYSSLTAAVLVAVLFYPLGKLVDRWLDRQFFQQELNRWRREYAGSLIHEIKTPLAAISLPAELTFQNAQDSLRNNCSDEELWEKIQKRMAVIMERSQQVGQRLDSLHALMSLDARDYCPVNLALAVQNALMALEDSCQQHKIRVNQTDMIMSLPVRGNLDQLEIVFSNLIKNGIEAMILLPESERELNLAVKLHRKQAIVRISDRGPGFMVEPQQLFKPFYSAKSKDGRGLGLFLCRQIIHAHDGTIEARNHSKGGAEFEIQIPTI